MLFSLFHNLSPHSPLPVQHIMVILNVLVQSKVLWILKMITFVYAFVSYLPNFMLCFNKHFFRKSLNNAFINRTVKKWQPASQNNGQVLFICACMHARAQPIWQFGFLPIPILGGEVYNGWKCFDLCPPPRIFSKTASEAGLVYLAQLLATIKLSKSDPCYSPILGLQVVHWWS